MDLAERTREFKLHFASARETFNLVMAALDGCDGEPGAYRDYRLVQVMDTVGRNDGSNRDHKWHSVETT
jgi:hypothetical protein